MSTCLPGYYWYGGQFKTDALFNLPFIMDSVGGTHRLNPTDDAAATLCDRYRIAIRQYIPQGPCAPPTNLPEGDVTNAGKDTGFDGSALGVFPMMLGTTFEGWQESQPAASVGQGQRVNGGCIRVLTYKCCTFSRISQLMTIPSPTIWAWRSGGPPDEAVFRPHTSCSWTMLRQGDAEGNHIPRGWQFEGATYTPNLPTAADIKSLLDEAHDNKWQDCVGPTFDMCLIAFIYAIYDSRINVPIFSEGCKQSRIGDGRVWLQGCIDTWSGVKC